MGGDERRHSGVVNVGVGRHTVAAEESSRREEEESDTVNEDLADCTCRVFLPASLDSSFLRSFPRSLTPWMWPETVWETVHLTHRALWYTRSTEALIRLRRTVWYPATHVDH